MDMAEKVSLSQTDFPVNFVVGGVVGVAIFDESNGLLYPLPKEIVALAEKFTPGTIVTIPVQVTVPAGATTYSTKIEAPAGSVYYVSAVEISNVPSGITGKYEIKIGGISLYGEKTLAVETNNILSDFGERLRSKSIELIVKLDSAQTSDVTVTGAVSAIARKDLIG